MPPDQPLAMLRELRFEETCKRPSTTNLERFTGSYVVYCMYLQDRGGGGREIGSLVMCGGRSVPDWGACRHMGSCQN